MSNTDILLAGAIAAFTVDLLVYPLDTLKTRLQNESPGTAAARSKFWKNPQLYKGLYQGVGSVVIATAPAAGVFFTTYEFLLSHTNSAVISSSIGEICSCAIITPAEVIKQNAQVLATSSPRSSNKSASHATKSGVAGLSINSSSLQALSRIPRVTHLWRGYTTLVGRNLPFTAMQFPVFEALKRRLLDKDSTPLRTGISAGVSAGAAGCVAAIITTPIDVVKTHVMLSAGRGSSSGKEKGLENKVELKDALGRQSGKHVDTKKVGQVVREILKNEGWKGFMRGGALRGVWTAVGSGLYLGSYEAAKVWLRNGREEKERKKITI